MPKHGWKWRTERVRRLNDHELRNFLFFGHCSAKLAKWIYKNLPGHEIDALDTIGFSDESRGRRFLWQELERRKSEEFGDWIVVALGRSCIWWPGECERYLALYEDKSAHAMRGSAVFGMFHVVSAAQMHESAHGVNPMPNELRESILQACLRAIRDDNPYARAGACWLGARLGGLDAELAPLEQDRTPISPRESLTVASHFERPDENE